MKQQSGFTLIELIMVIVILGILAATALPKFTDMAKDARIAKLNGARSAVLAVTSIVHGTVLARGRPDAAACPGGGGTADNVRSGVGSACMEHGVLPLANGYPDAGSAVDATVAGTGIVAAAGLTPSTFTPTLAQLNAEGYGASVVGATATFSVIGGSDTTGTTAGTQLSPNCSFTYAETTNPSVPPVISVATTSGC